jgi:hypothetical protein
MNFVNFKINLFNLKIAPATYKKLAPDHVFNIREDEDSKQLNNGTDLLYSPLYLTYHQEWQSIDVSS